MFRPRFCHWGINLEVAHGERNHSFWKERFRQDYVSESGGGVDLPDSGKIFFDGTDITTLPSGALALYRRKEIGFIFQSFNLFSTLTVGRT